MNPDRQAAVGAFVLGGFALAVAAVVLFGRFNLFEKAVRAVVVFQDSIAGLSVGAPVTFRGVRVGSVQGIAIQFDTKSDVAYIPVTLAIDPGRTLITDPGASREPDLADMVKRGLRAELNVQSFVTGQSEIDLDFDLSSVAVLHPEVTSLPEIPTRQSTLQRATQQLSQIPLHELVDNTTATLQSLRGLAEKLDRDLPPLVASLQATSDRSGVAMETATAAMKDLQGRLAATLGAIEHVAATGSAQLDQRGADLHTVLVGTNQTLAQVRDLLGNLRGLTSDRAVARTNLESTLRDLAAAAASLRGFASDVEHDPQLLLTGRRP